MSLVSYGMDLVDKKLAIQEADINLIRLQCLLLALRAYRVRSSSSNNTKFLSRSQSRRLMCTNHFGVEISPVVL